MKDSSITKCTEIDESTGTLDCVENCNEETFEEIKKHFIDLKTTYSEGTVVGSPYGNSLSFFKDIMPPTKFSEKDYRKANQKSKWEAVVDKCKEAAKDLGDDPIERMRWYYGNRAIYLPKCVRQNAYIEIDCDACRSADVVPEGVVRMYELLWRDSREVLGEKKCKEMLSADTMNSFFTLYKSATKLKNKWAFVNGKEKKKEEFRDLELQRQFELFAYLTHTAGNFIPCYGGFNPGRYYPTMDFWDLTLKCIEEWYSNNRKNDAERAMCETPLNVSLLDQCAPWLESFLDEYGDANWKTFVAKNYLDPFVEDDGEVRLFFDKHGFGRDEQFPEGKNLKICLKRINSCIIARGNLIRNKLKAIYNEPERKGDDKIAERALQLLFAQKPSE